MNDDEVSERRWIGKTDPGLDGDERFGFDRFNLDDEVQINT